MEILIDNKAVDSISLWVDATDGFRHQWADFCLGDTVPLDDGIYIGAKGSSCIFQGILVAAWNKPNHIIPFGTPRQRKEMESQINLEDTVAHITMDSLREGCRREHLNWEEDCLPRIKTLVEFLVLEIEPVHLCMMAGAKLSRLIKRGRI